MATLNKFFEKFRNLKSDAVPRPPRPNKDTTKAEKIDGENNDVPGEDVNSNEPEEILVESDDNETENEKKPKFKKSFFRPNKKGKSSKKSDKHSNSTVNTQATGNVINVVNSKNVRWGNDYYMGPAYMTPMHKQFTNLGDDPEEDENNIKKCNNIKILLEATIKPEHEYIDYIAKNLGKDWQKFFLKLGYSKNRIETVVIDTEKYGVSEARYKLLLDWINNEDEPSLGRLATLLWENNERQLVKELALLYKGNKN